MRSRKVEDLYADVEEGHLSCCHVHLANMSYRLGKETPFDSRRGMFSEDAEASEAFGRMQEHLADNRLLMKDTTYRLGRTLRFDARAERVDGDSEAGALATRIYRQPYVVPEKIG